MTSQVIASLEKLLGGPRDNALLHFSLGSEYSKIGDTAHALEHFAKAVELDPLYSAAWKLLGRMLADSGKLIDALTAYRQGIAAAEKKGDKQAAKEMSVFARRLEKSLDNE